MNTDFNTLIDFLDRLGPDASGRMQEQPHSEAALKLERFASGTISESERREVCEMLKMHPVWLRWLADRVRLARTAAPV